MSGNAILPAGTLALSALTIEPDGVYAFDFDGVLCASDEDDIYGLDPWEGEAALLTAVAQKLSVRCAGMEPRYQRHLLYQACALTLGLPTEAGPALGLFREATQKAAAFVLTARSGWHATERLRRFLAEQDCLPVEIFHVGRVPKDRQLALLQREYAPRRVSFIEDNPAHLATAAKAVPELDLYHVPRARPRLPDGTLRQRVIAAFGAVIG